MVRKPWYAVKWGWSEHVWHLRKDLSRTSRMLGSTHATGERSLQTGRLGGRSSTTSDAKRPNLLPFRAQRAYSKGWNHITSSISSSGSPNACFSNSLSSLRRQKKEGGWWGEGGPGGGVRSQKVYSASGCTIAQPMHSPSYRGSRTRHFQHEGNHKHILNIRGYVFICMHTSIYVCVYTYTHMHAFWVDACFHTYLFHSHENTMHSTHTHTPWPHTHSTRLPWALLLKNVWLTHFTTKNSQCICLVYNCLVCLHVCQFQLNLPCYWPPEFVLCCYFQC